MPRIRHLSSAVAIALACSGTASAQSFSNVISFGDSLTDAGNVAAVDGNPFTPPGSSFTTNPDNVYAQELAAAFGFAQTNSLSGGSNFAFGGACVRANSATFTCGLSPGSFSLTSQLTGYLAANCGAADGNALYTMWGGANDIFTYAGMVGDGTGGTITPTQAQQLTGLSAQTMVGLIGTLQAAGAHNIVVFNLPDLGSTPYANAIGAQSAFSGLSFIYNQTFNTGLASLGDGIIPINVNGLVHDVLADPGAYGFTNVTGTACGTLSGSLACGPAGDPNYFFHYAAGDDQAFFFADGVHPTGAAHAMLAQAVVAEITAPSQVAMLAEASLKSYEDQSRVIDAQIFDGHSFERADDSTKGFANLQFSNIDYDATGNTPQTDINQTTLTVGGDYRGNENYNLGGAISLSSQQIDAGSARIDGRAVTFSLYGVWNFGGAYIDAVLGGGSDNFDIERHIQLGAADRVEEGNTSGSHTAFELGFGYLFGSDVKHGPFIDATWQKVDVNDFAEEGPASTQMTFSDFDRDSLITRIGYQLQGDMGGWHPYARVAYNHESENDPTQVTAGLVTMNGHFTMPGLVPSEDWWTAELGAAGEINDTTSLSVTYSGLFADDQEDRNTFNLGVAMKF